MAKKQVRRRLRKVTVPCDKLSNHMFNYPPEEFAEIILNAESCECVEGHDRKGKEIVTPYWLTPPADVKLPADISEIKPLTPFDREVMNVAIGAYEAGYRVLSFTMTLNTLSGEDKDRVYSEQLAAIKTAVKRLMTIIRIDLAPLLKAFPKYRNRHVGDSELISPILPAKIYDVEINGQKTLAIELLAESPLMTVAKLKRQVVTYDLTPLAVPNQHNTPQVIVIKNYLLRRIVLIRHGLNPTILFKTLYENCGLADASDSIKQNARKEIFDTLNHFKAIGVIKDYEIEREGNVFRAIKIINA